MTSARQIYLGSRRGPALPYDAEVEYLRNTGLTQWIDTGVIFSGQLKILARFTSHQSARDKWAFAAWDRNARIYAIYQYTEGFYGGGYGSFWNDISPMPVGQTVDVDVEFTETNYILTIDGVVVGRRGKNVSGTFANSLWLFNLNDGSNGKQGFLCDFGRVQMFVGDTLIRDFVPIRFTNERGVPEGAMYDRANPTVGMNPDGSPRTDGIYRNRGTGAFGFGTDIAGGGV